MRVRVRFRVRFMFRVRFKVRFRVGFRFRVRVNSYPNPNQLEESPSNQSEAPSSAAAMFNELRPLSGRRGGGASAAAATTHRALPPLTLCYKRRYF